MADPLCSILPSAAPAAAAPAVATATAVLVVQTKEIGDVVLSSALCNTLKLNAPRARIDCLVLDYCAPVLEGNPHIDDIIAIDAARRHQWPYLFSMLRQLRARRYDVVINVQGQLIGLLACLASAAPRRIGFDSRGWQWAHTDRVPFRRATQPQGHGWTVDDRFALLKPLALPTEVRQYAIWLSDAEHRAGRAQLAAAGVDPTRPLIALGLNARDARRRWPLQHYVELARWLIECHRVQLLVYCGPGEAAYNRQLRAQLPPAVRTAVFDHIDTPNLRAFLALLAQCRLYVGNDTGPRHLAQALAVPTLALVSPCGYKAGWLPWHHPRHRGLDVGDALGLTEAEWARLAVHLHTDVEVATWFAKLRPAVAIAALQRMLTELSLLSTATAH